MHQHHHDMPMYTGAGLAYPTLAYPPHGFCHSCCHPVAHCCCHRQCRKEPRELLVQPTLTVQEAKENQAFASQYRRLAMFETQARAVQQEAPANKIGFGQSFIGGACCVYLSIEYAPQTPTSTSAIAVIVDDSEGTMLGWVKVEQPGTGYRIKECIITTKPGADLTVIVVNATARVRWCEIFSC